MAKKMTTSTAKKAPTTKKVEPKKESKVQKIEPAPKRERISGDHMVAFVSNGLSRYMNKAGKIHYVTADHAQLLIDKGLGTVAE